MRRLICTFVVCIWQKQVFSWRGSIHLSRLWLMENIPRIMQMRYEFHYSDIYVTTSGFLTVNQDLLWQVFDVTQPDVALHSQVHENVGFMVTDLLLNLWLKKHYFLQFFLEVKALFHPSIWLSKTWAICFIFLIILAFIYCYVFAI